MGKIIVSENVTLDGVVQDPTGDGDFSRGGWFLGARDKANAAWAEAETEEALSAEALLLGRGSYEYFATRWASRTGVWADKLNSMPKFVVSSTLGDPAWNNSTVLNGNVVDEVSKLKDQLNGEIVVYASRPLVHTLIGNGLADELRLMIHPFVLGAGERLFGETNDTLPLRLTANRTIGGSLAYVTYEVVRTA